MKRQTEDGWFETEEELAQLANLKTVQGELYRVDNATTLEGQRMTSNTLHFTLPDVCPEIKITSEATNVRHSAGAIQENEREYAVYSALPYSMRSAIQTEEMQPQTVLSAGDNKVAFTSNLADLSVAMHTTCLLYTSPSPRDM